MLSTRFQALLIFIGGLFLFTLGLYSQEIIGFESRFYLFALEMWRHGPSWFPTTYQQPYPDYPATSTWLIYLISRLAGSLNKLTAVFPSACASAITLAVTYLIGTLHSRRLGFMAVLFLLFTVTFISEARTISLDQFTTAITTVCFYLIFSANELRKSRRVFWIFPLFILGFAFRGPIGLIIPAGVVCVFYLLDKNIKRVITVGLAAVLLLVVCSTILLWGAHHVGGMNFLQDVLQMEVLGRMQEDIKPLPFYFYFQESFGAYAITYPLAILVLVGLFSKKEDLVDEKLLFKLVGWIAVVMIGLSIPADKKIRYILSISPALALICAYLFVAKRDNNYLYILRSMFVWFCFYFPLLCLVSTFFIQQRFPDLLFSYYAVMIFFLVVQLVMFFVLHYQKVVFALAVFTFVSAYMLVIEPINLALNKTKEFVQKVEKLRHSQHAQLAFYREGVDGLVIKYLIAMPQEERPIFINNNDELSKFKGPLFLIATHVNAQHIPQAQSLHILLQGKIGHERVIVFDKLAK